MYKSAYHFTRIKLWFTTNRASLISN